MLRITVILGLLAGIMLSPKLWLSSRLYPLTPVWSLLKPFHSPADHVVFFALVALLIASMISPRREILSAVLLLLALLALQDQSRWQPWFYQYAVMLLAIALAGAARQAAAFSTCCLIMSATYFWSGMSKLNPDFISVIFPALIEPFLGAGRAPAPWLLQGLAYAAPLFECAAGVGLLFRRFRPAAIAGAIAIHVFILISIGPLGSRFNIVVWPWNLAMIALLLILFFKRTDEPCFREIAWGSGFAFQKVVLILFAILPAMSFFNLWDHYLSSALYSGNRNSGIIYLNDDAFERLPESIQDYVYEDGPDRGRLDINDWSYGELNVPSYPEFRIYKNVARQICRYTLDGSGLELVIQGKLALLHGNRRSVYRCPDLRKF